MTLIAAQVDSIWGDQPLTIVLTVSGVLYDSAVMTVAEVAGVSVASATIDTSDYDAVLVDATIRTDVGAIVWVGQFQLNADGELVLGGTAGVKAGCREAMNGRWQNLGTNTVARWDNISVGDIPS